MLKIYDATVEHLKNPMCIDNPQPRFSWKLISDKFGVVQTEYQITVKCGNEIRWDSGLVFSDQSCNVIYSGASLKSREQLSWSVRVKVRDENGSEEEICSEQHFFEMGLLEKEDWKAEWIEPENEVDINARKPAPYLRKYFDVKQGLVSARIYQTAHGLYEFWINGEEGTLDRFKPGLTSYYHRIQYQMHDITAKLKEGKNCWSVVIGDGWWRGVTGGTLKNNFGYKLGYFGQIELAYADGTTEIIPTDESFMCSTGGLLASDMLMGEIYDARIEPIGWKLPEFDDSGWQKVHTVKDDKNASLIASASVPVREKERFAPILLKDSEGKDVLDFGQNIAGYVKMRLRDCKEGQKITLVHGEGLKEGAFSIANINKCSCPVEAFQQVEYICRGEAVEEYCPCFAVFGFRYVCVEGYENISPEDFEAIAVYSDMPEVGDFTCSDELINKLVKNSRWSQKGNFLDVAVDCPTRERNAWTGDAQVYVRTSTNFMDTYSFYEKWLQDQAIEQYASGKVGITFPSTSSTHQPEELEKAIKENKHAALAGPTGNGNIGEDAVGWGDSAVWLPYITYLCYGDTRILENQYETSRKWVDFMLSCAKEHNPKYEKQLQYKKRGTDGVLDGEFIYDTKFQYGEWNEPIKRSAIENAIFMAKIVKAKGDFLSALAAEGKPEVATAYMYRSACNVAQMAKTLGKAQDAEKYSKLAERIKGVYQKYIIKKDGTIQKGHQAPYVRALTFGLCSEEQKPKVLKKLLDEIKKANYHLNTGFLSTPFLLPILVDNGYTDIAYRILEQKDAPGWLYTVSKGATTIPESWTAIDDFGESLNHYSYGAVCEFLFAYTAGIRPVWETPGYSEFILKPVPGGSLTKAKAEFESPFGKIISEWEKKENGFEYHCEIPANTKAVLTLPNGEEHRIGSGSYDFTF